ncbi:hypothetical protein CYMTET_52245 [Cymbomonas tetramitiformis]|uniref:Uncharacterized protein n=1 Tax=Cymbomonas tetramitiformis TaxID=36881 RepID=A0AAE0EQZ5_9CHLO|nr:hypothetical protein CYMTET_52245 [Cymbomonas tetramitiformis]
MIKSAVAEIKARWLLVTVQESFEQKVGALVWRRWRELVEPSRSSTETGGVSEKHSRALVAAGEEEGHPVAEGSRARLRLPQCELEVGPETVLSLRETHQLLSGGVGRRAGSRVPGVTLGSRLPAFLRGPSGPVHVQQPSLDTWVEGPAGPVAEARSRSASKYLQPAARSSSYNPSSFTNLPSDPAPDSVRFNGGAGPQTTTPSWFSFGRSKSRVYEAEKGISSRYNEVEIDLNSSRYNDGSSQRYNDISTRYNEEGFASEYNDGLSPCREAPSPREMPSPSPRTTGMHQMLLQLDEQYDAEMYPADAEIMSPGDVEAPLLSKDWGSSDEEDGDAGACKETPSVGSRLTRNGGNTASDGLRGQGAPSRRPLQGRERLRAKDLGAGGRNDAAVAALMAAAPRAAPPLRPQSILGSLADGNSGVLAMFDSMLDPRSSEASNSLVRPAAEAESSDAGTVATFDLIDGEYPIDWADSRVLGGDLASPLGSAAIAEVSHAGASLVGVGGGFVLASTTGLDRKCELAVEQAEGLRAAEEAEALQAAALGEELSVMSLTNSYDETSVSQTESEAGHRAERLICLQGGDATTAAASAGSPEGAEPVNPAARCTLRLQQALAKPMEGTATLTPNDSPRQVPPEYPQVEAPSEHAYDRYRVRKREMKREQKHLERGLAMASQLGDLGQALLTRFIRAKGADQRVRADAVAQRRCAAEQGAGSAEAGGGLHGAAAPVQRVSRLVRRRMVVKLTCFARFVDLVEQSQDLHSTQRLCGVLGQSLITLQLNIPLNELREYSRNRFHTKVNPNGKDWQGALRKSMKSVKMRGVLERNTSRKMKKSDMLSALKKTGALDRSNDLQLPVERMLGTALMIAWLDVKSLVSKDQLHAQLEMSKVVQWTMPNSRPFTYYVDMFKVMFMMERTPRGWYYRTVMWNLVLLQNSDGSYDICRGVATALHAGDTSMYLESEANYELTTQALLDSMPEALTLDKTASLELKAKVWATLCSVERYKLLPFGWVVNPQEPPSERRTLEEISMMYLDRQTIHWPALEAARAGLMEEAAKVVKNWNDDRVEAISNLRTKVKKDKDVAREGMSEKEKKLEWRQGVLDELWMMVCSHPFMAIWAVKATEPFTRAQRILVMVNGFMLMLMMELWLAWSRASLCCTGYKTYLGCSPATADAECWGYTTCFELYEVTRLWGIWGAGGRLGADAGRSRGAARGVMARAWLREGGSAWE